MRARVVWFFDVAALFDERILIKSRLGSGMTIAVSVKIGEGLVLAADSTTSFFSENVLAQSYHHARKLLQLGNYPIGLLTYGLGQLAGRNLESLVAEFEQRKLTPWQRELGYSVRDIAQDLHAFISARYESAYPRPPQLPLGPPANPEQLPITPSDAALGAPLPAAENESQPPEPLTLAEPLDPRIPLGIVIGGYSSGEFFPDEFQMLIPIHEPIEIWPDPAEQRQQYGVRWWGQTKPIERLYLGCDTEAVKWFTDNGIPEDDAWHYYMQLKDRLMWPIIYEGMPLQDAIDLAVYLVNVTIGHSRFAVGPPVCGGRIDVATITARGFRWIHQKDLVVKTDSVFF